jgi:hypothetical protein
MIIAAHDITLYFYDEGWNKLAAATSGNLEVSSDIRETTNEDENITVSEITSVKKWLFSGNCLVDYDQYYNLRKLLVDIVDRNKIQISFSTEVDGDYRYYGYAYINQLSMNLQTEQNFTFTFTATGDGELSEQLIS